MLYTIQGYYEGNDIKDKPKKDGGTYKSGNIHVRVDNGYDTQGKRVDKFEVVPFEVWGKVAEKCEDFKYDDLLKIEFNVSGWAGKDGRVFSKIKAAFVNQVKTDKASTEIPF